MPIHPPPFPRIAAVHEVVITGIGIVCPLGVGRETVWSAIERRQSGVRTLPWLEEARFPITIGGEVPEFDPKQYVKPRKSLKVMCRETRLAFAATELAWADAALDEAKLDPERLGVVLGTNQYRTELKDLIDLYRATDNQGEFDFSRWKEGMREMYPLWMLRYLPNMAACHIGIAHDARGPTNSIVEGDVSALLTIIEAADVVARGHADVMLAGASSTMLSPIDLAW
ncbi:MAG: beta-ketoacyl-[acyl-carrier-protein] synthase family protein, partial [Planctomycetes bacterium]|nr:beta-ketoacyl-[acyl-carrier-protein] synthase family protein [Planctomycetota bacterium]